MTDMAERLMAPTLGDYARVYADPRGDPYATGQELASLSGDRRARLIWDELPPETREKLSSLPGGAMAKGATAAAGFGAYMAAHDKLRYGAPFWRTLGRNAVLVPIGAAMGKAVSDLVDGVREIRNAPSTLLDVDHSTMPDAEARSALEGYRGPLGKYGFRGINERVHENSIAKSPMSYPDSDQWMPARTMFSGGRPGRWSR